MKSRKGIRTNSIISQIEAARGANRVRFSWKNASFYRVRKDTKKARQKMLSDIAASKAKPKNLNDGCVHGHALAGTESSLGVATLAPGQVAEVYAAKCKDLRVGRVPNQELRFQEYCRKFCVDGKIALKEVLRFSICS